MTAKTALPRVKHLRDKHKDALFTLASFEDNILPMLLTHIHRPFNYALAIDPTPKAVYMTTVIRWLLARAIRFEDARRIRTVLTRFDSIKHRLNPEQRDIGRYETPGDLQDIIDPSGVVEREIPESILRDSGIVATGPGWNIRCVTSSVAAEWWAQGTSWCTADRRTAMDYLLAGPFHIVSTDKQAFQFHQGSAQFMDRRDRPVGVRHDIPMPALEALLAIASKPVKGTRFHCLAAALGIETVMDDRDGGDRVRSRPRAVLPYMSSSRSWVSLDGRRAVVGAQHDTDHGITLVDADDEQSVRFLIDDDVWEEIDAPHSILASMLVSGIRRRESAIGKTGIVPRGMAPNEISVISGETAAEQPIMVLVDSNPFIVLPFVKEDASDEGCPMAVRVLDLTGEPGQRVHVLADFGDVADAPARIRQALAAAAIGSDDFLLYSILGPDVLEDAGDRSWTDADRRASVLSHAMRYVCRPSSRNGHAIVTMHISKHRGSWRGDMRWSVDIRPLVMRAFAGRGAEAIWRMLMDLRSNDIVIAPANAGLYGSTDVLIDNIDVVGIGGLLAGVPDEDCCEDDVDALLRAGRIETVLVLPPRLITVPRLRLALDNERTAYGVGFIASRTLSMRTCRLMREAHWDSSGLQAMEQIIDEKGAYFVRTALKSLPGRSDTDIVPTRSTAGTMSSVEHMEDLLLSVMHRSDNVAHLEAHFEGLPPVARPWPLALLALRRSLFGLEEVLLDLHAGGWGQTGRELRMAEIMAIPGAEERIARYRKKAA